MQSRNQESQRESLPILRSIQVGQPRLYAEERPASSGQEEWYSAIVKTAVEGLVWLGRTHLQGDGQADKKYHGGLERAVLAYSADHYQHWRRELPALEMSPGAFGENFTISGSCEQNVCIGDTYRVGEVLVQVSQPRGPCWKLGRRWNLPDLVKRVETNGRTGWYLRVLQEGRVEAGLPLELIERPFPQWSVSCACEVLRARKASPHDAAALANCELLSRSWRETLRSDGSSSD
jgi:MOSC domain-containing protein YiiM